MSSFPAVRPADQDNPCEFLFTFIKEGADAGKVTPCCQRKAEVQVDFGKGGHAWQEKTFALLQSKGMGLQQRYQHLCIDHAVSVLTRSLLEQMGTPYEFGTKQPGSLKIFLKMWLRRQL